MALEHSGIAQHEAGYVWREEVFLPLRSLDGVSMNKMRLPFHSIWPSSSLASITLIHPHLT